MIERRGSLTNPLGKLHYKYIMEFDFDHKKIKIIFNKYHCKKEFMELEAEFQETIRKTLKDCGLLPIRRGKIKIDFYNEGGFYLQEYVTIEKVYIKYFNGGVIVNIQYSY